MPSGGELVRVERGIGEAMGGGREPVETGARGELPESGGPGEGEGGRVWSSCTARGVRTVRWSDTGHEVKNAKRPSPNTLTGAISVK